MCDPIIGAAVIGAGASLYAGDQAASAANNAANAQTAASQQAIRLQEQQRDIATQTLTPYVQEGNAARSYYNAFLGLPGPSSGSATGAASSSGLPQSRPDYAGYRAQWDPTTAGNPSSPWHQIEAGLGDPNAPDYDQRWAEAYNRFGGPQIGTTYTQDPSAPQTPQSPQDIAATRDQAYAAFEQSPYVAASNYGMQQAQNAIMGSAGAGAGVLRGRTVNALQNNATGYRANALLSYMDSLNGVAARGFDASSGIASAGQTFANNAGAAAIQGAAGRSNALMAGASAQSQGILGAATIGAYGVGQYANRPLGSYYGANTPLQTASGPSGSAINLLAPVPTYTFPGG